MHAGKQVSIKSEVAALRTVLLHRPGNELESLTPQYLDAMLFEDIPFLEQMQEEHDLFAQTLQNEGCTVLYIEKLLEEVLAASRKQRQEAIACFTSQAASLHGSLQGVIREFLEDCSPAELVEYMIKGIRKTDVDALIKKRPLSYYIRDTYPYYISPLPNLYFTRDPATALGNTVLINRMHSRSRNRETWLVSHVMRNHPLFDEIECLDFYAEDGSIEGGDILVLSSDTAAVGCSARTTAGAIEEFACWSLAPREKGGGGFSQLVVIQLPFTRAYMHLDTVFTMLDADMFFMFPGVQPHLHQFLVTRSPSGELVVTEQKSLEKALARALSLPAVSIIQSGGGDSIAAAREQWNDSTNTLAVGPRRVVTYRRNMVSNETLEKNGVEVISIKGSELVRGRGGPRCMSMPLCRES